MKILQIILGAILSQTSAAAPFDKSCLRLSENAVGNPNVNDRTITNDVEILKTEVDSKMRMH